MKAVMVMYDSLDRNFLSPYGCTWTHTPNFERLSEKATRFDNFYVGSMPCMPARRELHTGRYNFLHRSWGPLEPFDDSMPELLKQSGIYTHLATDHYHYWQDGGATYHSRYSSYEFSRGQEGDAWKAEVKRPDLSVLHDTTLMRRQFSSVLMEQDLINRKYMTCDAEMPQSQTFANGLAFLDKNHAEDNWFLTIETFDPHEPFFTQDEYKKLYPHEYHGKLFDWPNYANVTEGEEALNHVRMEYAALVSMCDHKLGLVLDAFDRYELWKDTMLIVCTDHGFLLGEHEWWGKMAPLYNEVANTPFFLYDPRCACPKSCRALCQTVDIAPTLLEYFGLKIPKDMMGKPLSAAYRDGKKLRDYALYGEHGGAQCITDGRWTFFRAPVDRKKKFEYTLMPTEMADRFRPKDFQHVQMVPPLSFTKGARVMRIRRASAHSKPCAPFDLLFDLRSDPRQEHNLADYGKRAELASAMIGLMRDNDAPADAYARLGLPRHGLVTADALEAQEKKRTGFYHKGVYRRCDMTVGAKEYLHALLQLVPPAARSAVLLPFEAYVRRTQGPIDIAKVNAFLDSLQDGPMKPLCYGARMLAGYFLPLDRP